MKTREIKGTELFYLVALVSTGVSANTSWRFAGRVLHLPVNERYFMFAILELTLIACGVAMRANVRRENGKPGPARILAWSLIALSAYMAIAESNLIEGIARVILGPAIGIITLHIALGIEIRIRKGEATGTFARIRSEIKERLLSRFGLGDDSRTAVMRTRDRAIARAARLATVQFAPFRLARLARAVRISQAAHDAISRESLMERISALQNIADLRNVKRVSPWRPSGAQEAHTQAPIARPGIETASNKSDAVRIALAHLGETSAQAVSEWLGENGWQVSTAYIRNIRSAQNRTQGAQARPSVAQEHINGREPAGISVLSEYRH